MTDKNLSRTTENHPALSRKGRSKPLVRGLQSEIEKLKVEIERLKKELKKRKKYGLVWEEKREDVVEMVKKNYPF